MTRPSLRWMVLIPILSTIAVGFALFAYYIDRVEQENRLADIDDELIRAERSSIGQAPGPAPERPGEAEPAPGQPAIGADAPDTDASDTDAPDTDAPDTDAPDTDAPDTDASDDGALDVDAPVQLIIRPDGELVAASGSPNPFDEANLADLAGLDGTHTVEQQNFRVRVSQRERGGALITALPLDQFDEAVSDFRRALMIGGSVMLVLVTAVLWFLTRLLIRPVTLMTATAAQIAGGRLETEIKAPSGSREMTDLALHLDRMVARLRSALKTSQVSAAHATAARDDMQRFLADMAHELRTPLTALKGYSDLYSGGMLETTDDVDRAMSRIGSESDRLHRLVDDMLQLTAGAAIDQDKTVVDLADVVAEVADDLRAAYPEHRIDHVAPPGSAAMVDGAPGRLHQALLNLGSNACHHSDPAVGIDLVLTTSSSEVRIGVVDRGPGIDPSEWERIFLPFYRAEASRSRDGVVGAGLGLALTKRIVDQHDGRVDVGNTPGGGTTMTLALPRRSVPPGGLEPPLDRF